MTQLSTVTAILLAILGAENDVTSDRRDESVARLEKQAKDMAETHAELGITTSGNFIFGRKKGAAPEKSSEYVGITPDLVYIFAPTSKNEAHFVLYPKGGEFIFVGKITGDEVRLEDKKPYRAANGFSQFDIPGTSNFAAKIIDILAIDDKSIKEKEEVCSERRKVLMAFADGAYSSLNENNKGKSWPIRFESINVSESILVDTKQIRLTPDKVLEKLKDMKLRKSFVLEL